MSGRGGIDVLLVEDDPGDALMVRESFAIAGRDDRFHVVPDGRLALRSLRQVGERADAPRPGLILLDLKLPERHGLEVLAVIKADAGLMSIPVVILSSSMDPGDIRRSYDLRADAYIAKPVDFDGFDDMISRIGACLAGLAATPPA